MSSHPRSYEQALERRGPAGSMDKVRESTRAKDIWQAEPQHDKVLLSGSIFQAVNDVLTSPINFHIWGKSGSPACLHCPWRSFLRHMLRTCQSAIGVIRYRRRHDQVLKTLAQAICNTVSKTKHACGEGWRAPTGTAKTLQQDCSHYCRLELKSWLGEAIPRLHCGKCKW